MTKRKVCHAQNIKIMKNSVSVSLRFDHQMYAYISEAARIYTKGCVCDLVGSLFLDRFEDLTKDIAMKARESGLDS